MTLEQVIAHIIREHADADPEYQVDPDKLAAHIMRVVKAVQGL